MNVYETIIILNPGLGEEEQKSATRKIADLITASGGEVLKLDYWGKRRLAFELNKQKFGHYTLFLYRSPASVIRKLEEYFKVFDPVIKYMVIRLGKKQIAALPQDVLGIPVTREEITSLGEPPKES